MSDMTLRLDGADASVDEISVGPDWPGPPESDCLLPYELEISGDQLVRSFSSYYRDYCSDGSRYPPDDDEPVARQLCDLDWPSLGELLAEQPRLFEELALDVGYDLLHELFAGRKRGQPRYWICSLDRVRLASNVVTLRGSAIDWQLRSGRDSPGARGPEQVAARTEAFLRQLMQKRIDQGLASRAEFRGCSDSEIAELEATQGLDLPSELKMYLRLMGWEPGGVARGSDLRFGCLHLLTEELRDCGREAGVSFPEKAFALFAHQGYDYLYLDLGDADPVHPVYRYHMERPGPYQAFDSLAGYFRWLLPGIESIPPDHSS